MRSRYLAPSREWRHLWLVRHGESTWNSAGLIQGQQRLPELTPKGKEQAQRCARRLEGAPVGAVVASDLRRAVETAHPIAQVLGVDVDFDQRLRERSFGVAEGTPAAGVGAELTGIDGDRVVDADAAPAGGESVRELYGRATGCVADLVRRYPEGDLVMVCHGGVVRVVLAWLDGVGPDEMAWASVDNGLVVPRLADEVREAADLRPPFDDVVGEPAEAVAEAG